MKRLLWILLLFPCSTLWAADSCKEPIQLARTNPYIAGAVAAAAVCSGSSPTGCLFRETFDGASQCGTCTSYVSSKTNCLATTWCDGYSNFYPTETTSPAPLQGTYSLNMKNSGQTAEVDLSSQSSTYLGFMMNLVSFGAYINVLALRDSGDNVLCALATGGGVIGLDNTGGTSTDLSSYLSVSTTYYIILYASSGTCKVQISTDGSSWSSQYGSTNGTWSNNIDNLLLRGTDAGGGLMIFDDIRQSSSTFNY